MPENLVTLVVASYNHADYIDQCLESVAAQTLKNFDLIVTDDASSDQSQEVLRRTLKKYGLESRELFHNVNHGVCATFNEALAQVRTPLVAFLSADDWMAPERLEEQSKIMLDAPATTALVYGDVMTASSDGVPTGNLFSTQIAESIGFDRTHDLFSRLLRQNWIPAPSVMSRTAALRDVGGYDPDLPFEDYDMWLRLARQYDFAFSNKVLVYRRASPNSLGKQLTTSRMREQYMAHAKILAKHLGVSPETDEFILRSAYRLAMWGYRVGAQPREVQPYLLRYAIARRSFVALCFFVLATLRVPGTLFAS